MRVHAYPSGPTKVRSRPTSTHAVEFVRPMRGASYPYVVRCQDGAYYIVKSMAFARHKSILANEMMAGTLALLIGLPVCQPAVVEVSSGLIPEDLKIRKETTFRHYAKGLQFGSKFPGQPGQTLVVDFLPKRLLRQVENLHSAFWGAFVFDLWTCNSGRREAVFCRPAMEEWSNYSAWLIDQDACFADGRWESANFTPPCIYQHRVVYEEIERLQSLEPYLSRIENVKASEIRECAEEIPAAWYGNKETELIKLIVGLCERRKRIRQFVGDYMRSEGNQFPRQPSVKAVRRPP